MATKRFREVDAEINAIDGAQRIYNAHCEDLYVRADRRPRRFSEIETDLEGEYFESAVELILSLGLDAISEAGSVADAWLAGVTQIRLIGVKTLNSGSDTTATSWIYDRADLFIRSGFGGIKVTFDGGWSFEVVPLYGWSAEAESEELGRALRRLGEAVE